jgi:uncharacterized protein (DUF934 family)
MPIIRQGFIVADIWRRLTDDEALRSGGAVLVNLKRFRAERARLIARKGFLGVSLKSEERAHEIGPDADLFDLIEVELPAFRDGRAFSTARLLRERFEFRGTIRARGHILPDQALFLARCGVDEIEIAPNTPADPFRAALREFSVALQPVRAGHGIVASLHVRAPRPTYAQAAE